MGQVLRDARASGTIIGLEAYKYVVDGKLVPSKLMEALTKFRLEEDDCKDGFILDGAPRKVEEAVILDDYLTRRGRKINSVLIIELPEEVTIKRLLKRKALPKESGGGRDDDNMEDIKIRVSEYRENIDVIKKYFESKDLVHMIDGRPTIEEIYNSIRSLFQL